MGDSAKIHLMVFFTYGISFKTWVETGLVGRELLIYKKMVEHGCRVSLITYGDETDLDYQQLAGAISIVPVYKYCKKPISKYLRILHSLILPLKLKNIFKSADLYKTNQMLGSWVPVICKFLYRKALVVRCGYEWFRNQIRSEKRTIKKVPEYFLNYLLELLSYGFADKVIISSQSNKEFIYKVFPIKKEKIIFIPNFIDTALFSPDNVYPEGEFYQNRILFVGRLNKEKNLDNLVKAIAGTYYGLDIVGQGKEKKSLQKLAEEEKADIRFLGVFPNNKLPKIINQYPVCILPSFHEDNPKTLMEAMACGKAVIGTNVYGIPELVQNGHNGLLCETDVNSIRKAINALMQDEALREALGKNARKFAVEYFSLNRIYEKEFSLYRKLLSDREFRKNSHQ